MGKREEKRAKFPSKHKGASKGERVRVLLCQFALDVAGWPALTVYLQLEHPFWTVEIQQVRGS
jgi:hypothetical protein